MSAKVVPQLLLEAFFWEGWLRQIGFVVGYVALIGALVGVLLSRSGLLRTLMIGLWSGYFLFGLVFTFHIHDHTYYSLQLIPVVALCLGPIADLIVKQLNQMVDGLGQVGWRGYGRVIVLALSVSALILSVVEHRQSISEIAEQDRTASKYAHRIAMYQEIGDAANHSNRTLVLWRNAADSGYALMYHGRLSGYTWPLPYELEVKRKWWRMRDEMSTEERFDALYSEHSPEYFIFSKKWWKSKHYEHLRNLLTESFPMTATDDDYVVFDLKRNGGSR